MIGWDVAVIGGGIAGSAAAALLAQSGLRVILFEKGGFPRQKVCGEFLSPEGADVLRRIGVWPRLTIHHPPRIHSLAVSAEGREARCRLPVPGWGVSRWILDQTLWDYARCMGVTARDRCTVQQIEGNFRQGFSLPLRHPQGPSTPVKARAVLCATGRQWPPWARRLGADGRAKSRFVGLKAHFHGVPLGGHVELHTIPHGYCGLVEVADGVSNLCCWVEVGAFRHAGCTPDRFLTSALAHNQPLRSRLRTAERIDRRWITTSVTGRRTATPVEESVWNIGDRVTMVAPLTGDGMGMGLRAAELAATILLMGFRREMPWEEATTEYARRWAREFLPRLRWGRCLEAIMLRPRSASLACLAMKGFPALTHMVYHRTRRIMPTTDSSMFVT